MMPKALEATVKEKLDKVKSLHQQLRAADADAGAAVAPQSHYSCAAADARAAVAPQTHCSCTYSTPQVTKFRRFVIGSAVPLFCC